MNNWYELDADAGLAICIAKEEMKLNTNMEKALSVYNDSLGAYYFNTMPKFKVRFNIGYTNVSAVISVGYDTRVSNEYLPIIYKTSEWTGEYGVCKHVIILNSNRLYNEVLKAITDYMLFDDKKDLKEFLDRVDKFNKKPRRR